MKVVGFMKGEMKLKHVDSHDILHPHGSLSLTSRDGLLGIL